MQAVSDEEMRRRLPKPPPKLWARPRGEVIAWLREVAEIFARSDNRQGRVLDVRPGQLRPRQAR